MPKLARSVLNRMVQLIAVLLAISVVTFLLFQALPGNAAANRIGPLPNFTPKQRALEVKTIEHQWGLDKPIYVQYGIWLGHAVEGNFGLDVEGESVSQLVGSRVVATVELGI